MQEPTWQLSQAYPGQTLRHFPKLDEQKQEFNIGGIGKQRRQPTILYMSRDC